MSTRRITQVTPQVEVDLGSARRITQVIPQAEVNLGPARRISQAIPQIEVKIPMVSVTPEWITGFEHGVASVNGGGLFSTFQAGCSIVSNIKHSGTYAVQVNPTSATAYFDKAITTTGVLVTRFYIRPETLAAIDDNIIFLALGSTNNGLFGYKASTNKFYVVQQGGTIVESNVTATTGQWFLVDLRFTWSGTTHTIDWRINQVPQTQYSLAGQSAETFSAARFGVIANSTTADYYFDDIVATVTNADYPVGPGGTVALVPNADGTHNNASNRLEWENGTDVNVNNAAYSRLNRIPMSSAATYIRQAATGTTYYAEVAFDDLPNNIPSKAIIGCMAILAYSAATTSANTGACIIYHSSPNNAVAILGKSGALADYSDGSTGDPYYKSTIVTSANNVHKVNGLRARLGYSNDVTPNPYWLNLMVEVAYEWTSEGSSFSRVISPTQGVASGSTTSVGEDSTRTISIADATSGPGGPVEWSGEGHAQSAALHFLSAEIETETAGSDFAIGVQIPNGNISTLGEGTSADISSSTSSCLLDAICATEGMTFAIYEQASFIDASSSGFGTCVAQYETLQDVIAVGFGQESITSFHEFSSTQDAIGSGLSAIKAESVPVSYVLGDGTGQQNANALHQTSSHVRTTSESYSVSLNKHVAISHLGIPGVGQETGYSITEAYNCSTETFSVFHGIGINLQQCHSFVEVFGLAESVVLTLKLKRYIDPDIIRGVSYVRTSMLGASFVRTVMEAVSSTRSSTLGKSTLRTSLQDKSHTRASNTDKSYVREETEGKQEL